MCEVVTQTLDIQ